jgi:hypothetical protein
VAPTTPRSTPDLVWLAFRGRDGEEARYLPTSPELEAFFIDLGFSPSVAEFISRSVIHECVGLLPERKRGRPPAPPWRRKVIEAQARSLAKIKEGPRASGLKGSVHKKAMLLLELQHQQMLKDMAPDLKTHARPFDYAQKKRSTK